MLKKSMTMIVPAVIVACVVGASVVSLTHLTYGEFDKRAHMTKEAEAYILPGLNAAIEEVDVNGSQVSMVFTVMSDTGAPLDLDGILTPGSISTSFLIAYIPQGERHYTNYNTRTQESPITGESAVQPTTDQGGSLEMIEAGRYRYTYGFQLPEGYDADATHTVGFYMRRTLTDFDFENEVANEVAHFVPSGAELMDFRDVVATDTCNSCHDPLAIHGSRRQKVEICVMCHYPGVIDPDTGNTVDLAVMTHKIHMGANLPSVHEGTPYEIIGFRQSVHDYSDVHFPQDLRNCETCHVPDATLQHDNWINYPTRDACGSCHDDVNFATGENHVGLPQLTDNLCTNCHFEQGELEYDTSIRGAHTVPADSTQLAGVNIEIVEVTGAEPGMGPTVVFTSTDNDGNIQPPGEFPFFNLLLAGPNEDYNFIARESATGAIQVENGFSYTFETPLPDDAAGSFTAGAEAYRVVLINEGMVKEFSHRETAVNPVFAFGISGAEATPRRSVVSDEKCDSCHKNLKLHGTIRQGPQYCVMCHQPGADDSPFREEGIPRSIDFKFMIHRIHTGSNLADDYTIVGFRGTPHNYNNLHYPGDRRNCNACHEGDSYNVPSPGILPTIDDNEFYSPISPNSAACLGCHDSIDAAAHTFVNDSPFGEACGSCHGEASEFSVSAVHAR